MTLETAMHLVLLMLMEDQPEPTHRGYGKILSDKTSEWETTPTFEGTPEEINEQALDWFTSNQHLPATGFASPWATYIKPIEGGSYELSAEQGNADKLLHASIGLGLFHNAPQAQHIQDVINKLFDLDYIKAQCNYLKEEGTSLWAQIPKFNSPVQHVREAVVAGYVSDQGEGKFALTQKGLAFAQDTIRDFNSRSCWHGCIIEDTEPTSKKDTKY